MGWLPRPASGENILFEVVIFLPDGVEMSTVFDVSAIYCMVPNPYSFEMFPRVHIWQRGQEKGCGAFDKSTNHAELIGQARPRNTISADCSHVLTSWDGSPVKTEGWSGTGTLGGSVRFFSMSNKPPLAWKGFTNGVYAGGFGSRRTSTASLGRPIHDAVSDCPSSMVVI